MKVIKSNTYNVVNTEPFDIPLPIEFELMYGNGLLASYSIHEDGQVDYSFSSTAKEPILTSTARPLELNDIYFLFSSRVFQDKTPFTESELMRFGIEEYNPYEIVRKTHGILPIDRYWIKFSDDKNLTYKKAEKNFTSYYNPPDEKEVSVSDSHDNEDNEDSSETPKETIIEDSIYCLESILEQKSHEYSSINDVGSILNEHKLDVNSVFSEIDDEPITESVFAAASQPQPSPIEPMPSESKPAPELKPAAELKSENIPEPETSGGNLSPEAIAALLGNADIK